MATLRLFAGLREVAGTSTVEVDGSTVDEILRNAVDRFGATFEASLPRARVWVNGEEAAGDDIVSEADEVALIPPVSGGAGVSPPPFVSSSVAVGVSVLVAVGAAHLFGSQAVFAAIAVGVLSMWVADVAIVMGARGQDLPIPPVLLTMIGAVVSTRLIGSAGLAITVVLGVGLPMGWAVASESSRLINIVAPTALVSIMAGMATASVLLTEYDESVSIPDRSVTVLLLILAVGTLVGALMSQMTNLPFGDPLTAVVVAVVLTSTAAAAIWDLQLSTFLLIGVSSAVGFIAGRSFGTVLRTHTTSLLEQSPGVLTAFDGAILAASMYYPLLRLLS